MARFKLKRKQHQGGWSNNALAFARKLVPGFNPDDTSHHDFCSELAEHHLNELRAMCVWVPLRGKA